MYAGSNKSNAVADDLTLNIRANIYLSKVNWNNRKRSGKCSKLNNKNTRMASMILFWCFIVNFEHICFTPFFSFSVVDFQQVIVSWQVFPNLIICWKHINYKFELDCRLSANAFFLDAKFECKFECVLFCYCFCFFLETP